MRHEQSAGFIVMRETRREPLFLLLRSFHGFWGFPKGGVEKGERLIDTAVRELGEETGINRFFTVSGFRAQYSYVHGEKKEKAHETVTVYLAKTDMARVALSREHTAYRWLSYKDMMKMITFRNAQRPMMRAYRLYAGAGKTIALAEKVYRETQRIPKGRVASYADIAKRCGSTPRAVAKILANNYDSRVPCYRVVSSSGGVLGYNRGAENKVRLLKKEGVAFVPGRGGAPKVAATAYYRY